MCWIKSGCFWYSSPTKNKNMVFHGEALYTLWRRDGFERLRFFSRHMTQCPLISLEWFNLFSLIYYKQIIYSVDDYWLQDSSTLRSSLVSRPQQGLRSQTIWWLLSHSNWLKKEDELKEEKLMSSMTVHNLECFSTWQTYERQ